MTQPALQQIRDDLAAASEVARRVLPTLLAGMPASDRDVHHQMGRAVSAAFDIGERFVAEARARHEMAIAMATPRRTA